MASRQTLRIEITDNTPLVRQEFRAACLRALEECGLVGEGYAKRMCPVDTGNLRNSITHAVDAAEMAAYIGSANSYAAYVELGTGIYYPGGRQDPWVYQDSHGNWHMTHGQRAQSYLKPAVADHVPQYKSIIVKNMEYG